MKHIYSTAILFLLVISQVFSQKIPLASAINTAGKQRMLGQRMAKNKLYIESNSLNKKAEVELEKAIAGFEKGINILRENAPSPTVSHKVDIQEYAFKQYKNAILSSSNKSMTEIIETNTLFLAICNDVVTELIDYSKTTKGLKLDKNQRYIRKNIAIATGASGKLRYLTQRLTLYFAINAFKARPVSHLVIEEIIETMDKNLNYLTALSFNTLEIDDALSEVQYNWSMLKKSLYINGSVSLTKTNMTAVELYDLCNTVLGKANTATKMYAELDKS